MPRINISVTEPIYQLIINTARHLNTTPSDVVKRAAIGAIKPYNELTAYNEAIAGNYTRCAQCGQYYWAKTARSKYCSNACRTRAHRLKS